MPKQSHTLRENPKLKALNPKQIPISKFKTQNPFCHLDFGHLILFSISDLVFRILFFEIATPSARNDRGGVITRHAFLLYRDPSGSCSTRLKPRTTFLNFALSFYFLIFELCFLSAVTYLCWNTAAKKAKRLRVNCFGKLIVHK